MQAFDLKCEGSEYIRIEAILGTSLDEHEHRKEDSSSGLHNLFLRITRATGKILLDIIILKIVSDNCSYARVSESSAVRYGSENSSAYGLYYMWLLRGHSNTNYYNSLYLLYATH
jgi:hypothetical protein